MTKRKIKICAITSTRADYGIMRPLLSKLNKETWCDLRLYVTGTHMLKEYGYTVNEIEQDNLKIDVKQTIYPIYDNDILNSVNFMSNLSTDLADYYLNNKIDVVILLGDRYEINQAASITTLFNIPIIHIAGGETTQGAIDEVFRHSITKMSYLHFASCEEYRKRIIQLGENPKRVFNVGALGVENVLNIKCLSKKQLSENLNFDLNKPYSVVTFHPVTLEKNSAIKQVKELMKLIHNHQEMNFIITMANADPEGNKINEEWLKFEKKNDNCLVVASLGTLRYFSAIKYCESVIGNSSSGIVEVPSFNKPTINIGDRQKGRIQASSIINCKPLAEDIEKALRKAKRYNGKTNNPYQKKNTSDMMLKIIKKVFYDNQIDLKKEFYDL